MPWKNKKKRIAWYKKRAKTQKYRDYNKKWRDENKEYFRKWSRENREKCRNSVRKWRRKNKEYANAQTVKWHKNHPWVVAYNGAKNRCTNKKVHNYHRYGGRGILFNLTREEVKTIWFRDDAYSMKRPTLDRINNDGYYGFNNCQFIEMADNVKKSNELRRHHV